MSAQQHLFFEGLAKPRAVTRKPAVFVRATAGNSPSPKDQTGEFYRWLFQKAGLVAAHYRHTSLARRMNACLRSVNARDVDEAARKIEADAALLWVAIDAALLGVTEFSRDPQVFSALATLVIPAYRDRQQVRIWSAACSEGHEVYSVAFLLSEAGLLRRCELLGTDCRHEAIEHAAAGVYPNDILGNLTPAIRARHFHADGFTARASSELRAAIRWRAADLFAGVEPGPWDMILWRNMAIYLTADSADLLWNRLNDELRSGGHLILGKADHPPASLGLRRIAACVYQKG